tara:strand:- start:195 stop:296 length:102 start_codon:yes stop_codon:yes gene_type:complete
MYQSITCGRWLGIAPSGKKIEMRSLISGGWKKG